MPMTAFPLPARTHAALDAATDPDWVPTLLGPDDERGTAEAFVARVYRDQFDARLAEFMPWLLVFHDRQGMLRAVVGLRPAKGQPLFVEQYLDQPAEQAVATALGRCIDRDAMVEVGGLAALRPGDARRLILCLTRGLHRAGLRWVLFAATRQLRNAFDRLGLATVALAPALASRLRPGATDWGRYYDTSPTLVSGDIAAGMAFLEAREAAMPMRGVGT
ncbi:thermostable hemolysin [Silanimonas algicola]